ncbi:MAG: hypothetical protein IPK02_05535 [Candidatus Accumulibacter sp.]|uniref:Uncharacterized protein n=1 Tax=Candidatus Accumulibacter affinis TaxID=2954384 RepID=A0A935T864_9PROT|nr:hypothetical protein [Candidatus Accumulibacter affinis]
MAWAFSANPLKAAYALFITWEKNANQARLMALPATDFTHHADQRYGLSSARRDPAAPVTHPTATPTIGTVDPPHAFDLRRLVLWNLRTHHCISVLCWEGDLQLSEEVLTAMLSR